MSKELWGGIKKLLAGIAPVLGNAILPGVGGVAGALLASVLGVNPDDPAALNTALVNATPDQIIKIKELAAAHEEKLIELGVEHDRMYILDKQSARAREIAIVQATGKTDKNLYVLAWVIMFGFFGTIIGIIVLQILAPVVKVDSPTLSLLLGSLSTDAGMVVGYFFGSSKSSQDKTSLLAQSAPASP